MCAIAGFILLIGLDVFVGTSSMPHEIAWAVLLPGIVLSVAGIIGMNSLVRCPRCKGNIGAANLPLRNWPLGARRIDFCPYCGTGLDETL